MRSIRRKRLRLDKILRGIAILTLLQLIIFATVFQADTKIFNKRDMSLPSNYTSTSHSQGHKNGLLRHPSVSFFKLTHFNKTQQRVGDANYSKGAQLVHKAALIHPAFRRNHLPKEGEQLHWRNQINRSKLRNTTSRNARIRHGKFNRSIIPHLRIKKIMKATVDNFKLKKYLNITEPPGSYHCQPLHYLKQPRNRTALASYMGSGNTWLRHLIQEATGIYTGSLYRDPYLYRGGFPAEGQNSDMVIVVKTHEAPIRVTKKAILLIRDPFKALLANFHRHNKFNSNEHTGLAPDSLFENGEWKMYIKARSKLWYKFNMAWLNFRGPLLVILYDSLKEDVAGTMQQIFNFLEVNVTTENFNCMLRNSEGNFKRKKHKEFLYDAEMVKWVLSEAARINQVLQKKFNLVLNIEIPNVRTT